MKTVILTTSTFLTSIIIVSVLYFLSENLNHKYNTFVRLFPPHPIDYSKGIDIKYNSYYIAGLANNHIYLGNVTAPQWIFIANNDLTDTIATKIKIGNAQIKKSAQVLVDSPYFYLADGLTPSIYKGDVLNWEPRQFSSEYFIRATPMSYNSFAIRSVSNKSHENILGKQAINEGRHNVKVSDGILEKQIDGLFCTDGELHYDKNNSFLLYMYFYRNQFIKIDTNLNIIFRGKTIDTISHAQIKVGNISSEKKLTLSAPPLMVNKRSCVFNNRLFVQSALLAKNESKKIFSEAAVIDVYNLVDGVYEFSFYIFDFNKQKLRDFKVNGNKLVALYETYLVTYNLHPKYFSNEY